MGMYISERGHGETPRQNFYPTLVAAIAASHAKGQDAEIMGGISFIGSPTNELRQGSPIAAFELHDMAVIASFFQHSITCPDHAMGQSVSSIHGCVLRDKASAFRFSHHFTVCAMY